MDMINSSKVEYHLKNVQINTKAKSFGDKTLYYDNNNMSLHLAQATFITFAHNSISFIFSAVVQ